MRKSLVPAAVAVLSAEMLLGLEIPLSVEEPAGVERKAEPVSCGIPLPWGQLRQDQPFSLFEGTREIPVQVLPLVVDEKGFLRWILVDFQTDLAPKEKKTFTLKTGRAQAIPSTPLRVNRQGSVVTVDTGKIILTVDAEKPFGVFSTVQSRQGGVVRPVTNGGQASYTDAFDGKTYLADKPASLEVEYAGPMRTTIVVKGRFVGDDSSKLQYVTRITTWAGRSDVHVKYSLCNSNPEHYTYRKIRDSTVALHLASKPEAVKVGGSQPIDTAAADVWMHQSMRVFPAAIHSHDVLGACDWLRATPGASEPGGCKVVSDGKELWVSQGKADVAEGWLLVKSGENSVWACDLYFVDDPPRRLAVKDSALLLTGVTVPLDGITKMPFPEKERWLFDCSHLSSQYLLDFGPSPTTGELSSMAKRARARLWGMAPPEWYSQTQGLPAGKFGTQADELACYEKWGWKYDPAQVPTGPVDQIARIRRWVGGDDNHFTSEQDTLDGLVLMYLRTGRRAFFDAAETWANYFLDLQTWRSDGWRWKDGGVWWHGGPAGNSPQRVADPVTGVRNSLPAEWTKEFKMTNMTLDRTGCVHLNATFLFKSCHCHNWGEGLVDWFLLTGDRDAYEAAIDTTEQMIDFYRRAQRREPGKAGGYSRDFTRASFLTHATRLAIPTDPFVVDASEFLAAVYLKRPNPEPRGFLNSPTEPNISLPKKPADATQWDQTRVEQEALEKWLEPYVGKRGIEEMKKLGVTFDFKTKQFHDPKTGARWYPLANPHTWMFPPMSRAMELYYRLTGNEDAHDWLIAYGQAVAHVLFQKKHGNLAGNFLVDFPTKGFAWDSASWQLPDDVTDGKGVKISGYLAKFHPDVVARAYYLCGEPFLKQRAYDYWFYGSHRGYQATEMHNVGGVGCWVNVFTTHDESVCFTTETFWIWSHERKDQLPPKPITDLKVIVEGETATVSFTAPADEGGGKVARYQVKCASKPIVDYETFFKKWAANEDVQVENWWMATNLAGEPRPSEPGKPERFTVTGVPAGTKFFAICSFDDSNNRSPLGAVVQVSN
ncbi:MAG: hypothetical protein N2255_02400 [Kiritimatiellae bacterium]|nr:hypothetical protein [Kiritimatiellia bacterium]